MKRSMLFLSSLLLGLFVMGMVIANAPSTPASESSAFADEGSGVSVNLNLGNTVQQSRFIRCNSVLNKRKLCDTGRRGNTILWKKHSRSGCVRGRDWGLKKDYIWVDNGCQATFRTTWR